ncbi:MAG TPA: immunoglobulin domain-containing protein [Anaerohalosphaeraceae bacterium]|nr:immunoglobulin domain-containing protein [Anaerohalosphaeraceae bacterium]HOL87994.1 immunoglobulin domain-containing protein [Anaerohalosphaeraceae bacterium]HPP55493.1 immunoglobulin domain-containing protein [Anaerohalosphaeraceae bacterium]
MKSMKIRMGLMTAAAAVCWLSTAVSAGVLVPGLADSTALVTYPAARAGVAGDHAKITTAKITLAARFNPDVSMMTGGPTIVIEDGGTTNGTGLYLGDGNLIFAAKSNNQLGLPTSMNDTDFSDNALAITIGPVKFGAENVVYASFDAAAGKLVTSINGLQRVYTITGSNASKNLDGNTSVSFLGSGAITPGHMGGLCETGATQFPLLFWNNARNMVQKAGYTNQLGQVFSNVETLELRAHNPVPATGATNVNPLTVTQLQFTPARDPNNMSNPNPKVTGHFVTVYQVQNGEPNLLLPPLYETFVPAGSDPVAVPFTFTWDQVVCWRVEEQIQGKSKGDPANLVGPIWFFTATPSKPIVTVSPAPAAAFPAGQASFTCEFTSQSAPTVTWYRVGTPDIPLSTSDPDISVVTIPTNGITYASTLTIRNIEKVDEGSYYCSIANSGGSEASASATLGVKRKVAHWTLNSDSSGYDNGQYLDISGEGHHATPTLAPVFSSSTPGTLGGQSLDMTAAGQPQAGGDSGVWATAQNTGETTVSVWINWAGPNGAWQGIVANRQRTDSSFVANYYIEIRQDNGRLQIGGVPGVGDLQIDPLPIGQWVHLVITAKAGEVVMYLNGQVANRSTAGQAVPQALYPVYFGTLGRDLTTGALLSPFNGYLDDIQIYNYALSWAEVVDLYYPVMQQRVCVNPNHLDLRLDVAGGGQAGDQPDCRVDLADFAVLASSWLNSGLYPAEE